MDRATIAAIIAVTLGPLAFIVGGTAVAPHGDNRTDVPTLHNPR